ncbi:MAG: FGGY family carbohydrate kinase [Sulfuricaulis sp.]|uniref:FGGY family carbohydrate kinase n=1 Tax=Sulfuricaulis sp. TaxID=2003553 RepID=UPI0025E2808B|nr:FGGY family carbohydrate kinase [Sulfuricaulis sp.]MCR4347667.1 FGGY family carbohydrate kinase [Sulfuricaulis sp.]
MSPVASDPLYLCLDQGGHASRALVFDGRGALQVSALREVDVREPRPGWVEQDPEELVASLQAVITKAVASLGTRADQISSAGLATQRSSMVCWDRYTGEALSPVISWQDRRAHEWLDQFSSQTQAVHQRTGLMLSAHYGVSKMRWCLDHLPAVTTARRVGRLAMGPLASFLLFRLLEEKPLLADPANAARTLLWNLHSLDWDPWLLEIFGISAQALPRSVPTRHVFGTLRANEYRIPLTIATGDQSAALYALGEPLRETVYVNMGTGAFIQRAFQQLPDTSGLLSSVVYRDADRTLYVLEGTVNGAGAALRWAEQEWGLKDVEAQLPAWLAHDGDIPLFLNGVAGLGAPFWAADFPSHVIGDGEPWQKVVAVAESIIFLLQENFEIMRKIPPQPGRLLVSGGLSRLDGLCQRLSDLSGLPVYRPTEQEATVRGTAYLLARFPANWPEEKPGDSFAPKPNPGLMRRYKDWRVEMNRALTKPQSLKR